VALSESGGAPTSVASPSSDRGRCMYHRFGSVRPIPHTRRRMAGTCAKPPRDWVSRMMFRDLRSIGSASPAVTLQSAPPTPERLLARYRGSEPCFRASYGPRGAAPCAGSWFVDRSETAWCVWNGSRTRPDRDQFSSTRESTIRRSQGGIILILARRGRGGDATPHLVPPSALPP
jgi:hypothetical protein